MNILYIHFRYIMYLLILSYLNIYITKAYNNLIELEYNNIESICTKSNNGLINYKQLNNTSFYSDERYYYITNYIKNTYEGNLPPCYSYNKIK